MIEKLPAKWRVTVAQEDGKWIGRAWPPGSSTPINDVVLHDLKDSAASSAKRIAWSNFASGRTALFLYGTLMKGCWNFDRFMKGRDPCFVSQATLQGYGLNLFSSGVPFIRKQDDQSSVDGQVWLVTGEHLNELDRLELGCGYTKDQVKVRLYGTASHLVDAISVNTMCDATAYVGGRRFGGIRSEYSDYVSALKSLRSSRVEV